VQFINIENRGELQTQNSSCGLDPRKSVANATPLTVINEEHKGKGTLRS